MDNNLVTQLSDLVPLHSKINLWVDGEKKQFTLRPFNMHDEVWVNATFGDQVESIFNQMKMAEICRIVYHQLIEKGELRSIEVTEFNDDGDEVTVKKSGPDRVMDGIQGMEHKVEVFRALLETIGISKPMLNSMEKKEVAAKKKVATPKRKRKSIGERSSIK